MNENEFQPNAFVKYNFDELRRIYREKRQELELIPDRNTRKREMVSLDYAMKKIDEAEKAQKEFDTKMEMTLS